MADAVLGVGVLPTDLGGERCLAIGHQVPDFLCGGELEIGYHFRRIFSGIKDRQIDRLFEILNSDGIAPLIRNKAQFDWHKDLILALARHAVMGKYLGPISLLAKGLIQ